MEKHAYAVFSIDLEMFIEIVTDVIAFRNPYLVKSVNRGFRAQRSYRSLRLVFVFYTFRQGKL